MCCWEWKPRYFCAWCRMPLFWHPRPGTLEPCLSSKVTGGCVVGNCVEGRARLVESESVYTGCCADCARLVGKGKVPAYYRDVRPPRKRRPAGGYDGNNNSDDNKHVRPLGKRADYDGGKKAVKTPKLCVIL